MEVNIAGLFLLAIYLPILILQVNRPFRKKFSKLNSTKRFSIFIEILAGLLYAFMIFAALYSKLFENLFFLIVGILIYLLGLAITYSGYYVFYKNKGLIKKFPFNISRNPTYLYGFVAIFGIVIMTKSLILLLLLIIQVFTTHYIILNEEKYLEKKFRKNYTNYKKQVRRYF